MAIPRSRDEMVSYVMRSLGAPVSDINIDESQVEDAVDDALSFWQDYHLDASKKVYIAHALTQDDIDNLAIQLDPGIKAVSGLFKFSGDATQASDDIFNVDYQLRLNDLWDLTSVNMTGYVIARQYISLIDDILNTDTNIRFREHEGILYLDTATYHLSVGMYIVIECYQVLDPDTVPGIWNDRVLRQLCAAYARKRYGINLIKYDDMELPNGTKVNGQKLVDLAEAEIEKLENEFIRKYSEPDNFWIA